jgi:hypothetical protein
VDKVGSKLAKHKAKERTEEGTVRKDEDLNGANMRNGSKKTELCLLVIYDIE